MLLNHLDGVHQHLKNPPKKSQEDQESLATMFQLTLKLDSTKEVQDNPLTITQLIHIQHPMLGVTVLNSLILLKELVNGGKSQ